MKIILQKLWPDLMIHKKILIYSLIFGVIVSSLKAIVPDLMRQLVATWENGQKEEAFYIPFFIASVWILAGVARYFHLFWMKFTSDKITVKLRRDLMNKYLVLSPTFHMNFSSGSGGLISRMLNDVRIIQEAIHRLADLVREPFLVLFSLCYLIYLDWKLTFLIVIALPIVTHVIRRLAKSLYKYARKNQEAMEGLTKVLKESLDGERVVRSFNLEDEMRARFNHEANYFLETRRKIVSREEASGPIAESLTSIVLAALMLYIGNQIFANNLGIEDFIGFITAVGLLQDSSKKVQDGYIKLQQGGVALERMSQMMNNPEVIPQLENTCDFPADWESIQFEDVSFSYGGEAVLKNIDFEINRGEIIAVVGRSGSGKSTLVNLLERFFDPTQGEIKIGRTPIHQMDLKSLRRNIALVSQDMFLFSDTIEKNIWSGDLKASPDKIVQAAQVANAHGFIEDMTRKYQTRVGDVGSRLSGGERQRICIARAILKDAPILILDEATSALDLESEKEVQKGLDELMKGRTVLVVAHRLSTIMKADRIVVLHEGRIVEQGNHSELVDKKGRYFYLQQLQSVL